MIPKSARRLVFSTLGQPSSHTRPLGQDVEHLFIASPTQRSFLPSSAFLHFPYSTYIGKGKGKAIEEPVLPPVSVLEHRSTSLISQNSLFSSSSKRRLPSVSSTYVQLRCFHATSPWRALPLIPGIALFIKTTSLLTAATAISRVLISFLPITTIATFRISHGVQWLSESSKLPKAGPEAEEFWKMWCEGEKGKSPTWEEAKSLIDAPTLEDDSIICPDGRIAFMVPLPEWVKKKGPLDKEKTLDKTDEKQLKQWKNLRARNIKASRFFLPPLPPASVRYYNELSPEERRQVDDLRRYWVNLGMYKECLWIGRMIVLAVIGIPVLLLFAVWLTGLERVPLTGRWRLILLTPEEEDAVSQSLEGSNWFKSVINLLTRADQPAPPIVPLEDWRWGWTQSILRRLEAGVMRDVSGEFSDVDKDVLLSLEASSVFLPQPVITPPRPTHPLKPRPRVSARLHEALPGGEALTGQEHLELGPPFSLMLMESDDKNAFAYGFGGKGASGIVIFTGLLDDILSSHGPEKVDPATVPAPPPQPRGLFGRLFSSPSPPPQPPRLIPTEKQTLHLASIIAHEMGHLLLSHNLEALSQQQVLWPSLLGLSMDLVRAFIWPITVLFGPTVNDALANVGRTSAEDLAQRYGQIGFQYKHEYEADISALRILAMAGFDPRAAVDFFAESISTLSEYEDEKPERRWWSLFKLWSWATHPPPNARVEAMKKELARWEAVAARLETEKAKKAAASTPKT